MEAGGIDAFWSWWSDGRDWLRAAMEARQLDEALVAEITSRIQAIHPKLAWEVGPGDGAAHAFCMTTGGDPELRRLTERWLRAAPPTDGVWELHAARRAAPGMADARLQIAEHVIPLADMRFTVALDPHRERMRVIGFHPAFAAMSEDMRGMATFITLDRILGEDSVQRWLGGLQTSVEPLENGGPTALLMEAVRVLVQNATGERFTTLEGRTADDQPMDATVNLALKGIDHLSCDTHVVVDVALIGPTPEGLPTEEDSDALSDIEDELEELISGDAAYLGRETALGRRTLHWFVPSDHAVRPQLEAWGARHADRDVRITWTFDPRWTAAARFQ